MRRGEIYWFDFGEALGSEAEGRRPGVVVSSDSLNEHLETVLVLPTSASDVEGKRRFFHNVYLSKRKIPELPESCVAQVHLLRHVSRQRLDPPDPIAEVPAETLYEISIALGTALETVNPMRNGFDANL